MALEDSATSAQVRIEYLPGNGGGRLPVVLPRSPDVEVTGWLASARADVLAQLQLDGALLLRGFGMQDARAFASSVGQVTPHVATFEEESSPRRAVEGLVSTSTDYPNRYPIQFHNEYSYSAAWPLRLFFFCKRPPEQGGETPIADSRRALTHISPATRSRFERHGVLYRRRFAPKFGVSWKAAFLTEDKNQVLTRCESLGIDAEWKGDELFTRQVGDAIVRHPFAGTESWFNHAFFFNVNAIEPLALRSTLLLQPENELSTSTYYGDGSAIDADVIEELRSAYAREQLRFPWQTGDLLMIDNMSCSHARAPYKGAREILAMMTDKIHRHELDSMAPGRTQPLVASA